MKTFALAMTGASGAIYGIRLMEQILNAGHRLYLMISEPGRMVVSMETDLKLPASSTAIQSYLTEYFSARDGQLQVFGKSQWTAPIASGSNVPDAMVICPCTSGTLAAIATGASRTLLERAGDVMIKEQRKLILVPREMPFSGIHLEHMLRLSRLGVMIMPACPGFYQNPESVMDLVDFVVARVLDQLGVDQSLLPRWGMEDLDDRD
ncbi:MAG: UbiX family flavin prenyltransferase [Gammaproteobacteria bacterium]|nr:MAG: UbiX family flavin prenyltransferase [Gammaproteobacteria bacterium]